MARLARCPSCGAPVEFKSVASIMAVCDYCQSTLLQDGEALQNLGKMAALVEDRSPLQRGAEGRWKGRRFGLIGRLQLNWEQGLWNEWYLLFDDMKSGWLSEANGEYVVSEAKRVTEALPAFDQLELGRLYMIDGRAFTLTNLLTATCVSGEGELPFKVGAGYPAPVADLRDDQGAFATLDYSDDPAKPLVFIGEPVAFKSLAWANLRDLSAIPQQPTLKARSFACPTCGAPLQVTHEKIETVGCGSCGAVLDTRNDKVAQIAQAQRQLLAPPLIPLGSKGTLQGEAVEVIGYMSRSTESEGVHYYWREYVLAAPEGRFVWLTEYDGHWNVARVLSRNVRAAAGKVRLDSEDFKHFSSYKASVDYVIGEFPWRVTLNETATLHDYVLPPRMLSQEVTKGEQTWTLGEYIEPQELVRAFGLKSQLLPPRGVYANQPNPHEENHRRTCRRFWIFSSVAVAIYVLLLFIGPAGGLMTQQVSYGPNDDEPKLTREFPLPRGAHRLEISHSTNLANNWVGLNMTLVNKETGEAWQAYRELSRYEGVDDGESWSEGSRDDEVVFTDLPPGTYLLAEEPDMDPGAPRVGAEVKIATAGPRWSSLLLTVIFLMAFPIWTRIRKGSFEVRRWADSDHPIVTSSSGDDD
jgi:hypothetical protein